MTEEQMHQLVLGAQALVKLRDAVLGQTGVELNAEEADGMLRMIQLLRQAPDK